MLDLLFASVDLFLELLFQIVVEGFFNLVFRAGERSQKSVSLRV